MRFKIKFTREPGAEPEFYFTNFFVITEWERIMHRKVQDLTAPMASDWGCWMWLILKLKGEQVGDNWKDWVEKNPDIDIVPILNETNPNPTDAAPTAAN
jgi:hypothetical protein